MRFITLLVAIGFLFGPDIPAFAAAAPAPAGPASPPTASASRPSGRASTPAAATASVPAVLTSAPAAPASPGAAVDLTAAIAAETERAMPDLVVARRFLHQHPELPNREVETGREIARRLRDLGYEPRTGVAHTGVVATLVGGRPGPVRVWRCDIDALPLTEATGLPFASANPGVMHACGHDVHMTVALGVATVLKRLQPQVPGTVVFLFQPAEEGAPSGEEGGAELVLKERAIAEPRPAAIFGFHVESELPTGSVGVRAGGVMASADRFTVHVRGRSSHGARPNEGVDAVYVAAQLVTGLQALVAREQDPRRPFVVTVGTVHGGSRYNIVAGEATLEGTVRTLDPETNSLAPASFERVVRGICQAYRATCEVTYLRLNPVNFNDPPLAHAASASLASALGAANVVEILPQTVAEDFAHYARLAPSFYFFLGVARSDGTPTSGVHSPLFNPDERAITTGVRAAAALLTGTVLPVR